MNDQPLQDAELRALAQQLGAHSAERVDPDAMAQSVLRRLRDERRSVRRTLWQPLWLSAAAAVVLLIGGSAMWRTLRPTTGFEVTATAGLDLNNLSADQLRQVLDAVDQPLDVDAAGSLETGLDDLTPRELRTLLRALEG